MKNADFWDVMPYGFYKNRLLVTASVVPSSQILATLMMEAVSSSGTSVLTRATRRNIPEDAILHSHHRRNLKSYIELTGWTL
jgi:phospholipid N-methyltransferase